MLFAQRPRRLCSEGFEGSRIREGGGCELLLKEAEGGVGVLCEGHVGVRRKRGEDFGSLAALRAAIVEAVPVGRPDAIFGAYEGLGGSPRIFGTLGQTRGSQDCGRVPRGREWL